MPPGRPSRLPVTAVAVAAALIPLAAVPAATAAHFTASRARQATAAGTISTIAGGPGGPGPATRVALSDPCALGYAAGSLYVDGFAGDYVDFDGGAPVDVIRQVSTRTDRVTTPAGGALAGVVTDGGPASTGVDGPSCGVAVDRAGNLVISEGSLADADAPGPGLSLIRVVAARSGTYYGQSMQAGHIYRIAGTSVPGFSGDGGPAIGAQLDDPTGLAVDSAGNVIVADNGNNVIRVIAAATGTFYGVPMTAGDIYTVAGDGGALPVDTGNGGPAVHARLGIVRQAEVGVQVDHHGNLVIADAGNRAVRVVPDVSGTYYGRHLRAGYIYQVAGDHAGHPRNRCGNTGSGGLALAAHLCADDVAVDRAGDLIVTGGGLVWVLAARTGTGYGRHLVAGHIYRMAAEGPADAQLTVAADGAGNAVFAAATLVGGVRVLAAGDGSDFGIAMRAGQVYRVAGDGWRSYSGDGGQARAAQLGAPEGNPLNLRLADFGPAGLAAGPRGGLVVADLNNLRVRVVAGADGRFYGVAMKAGRIYTIAGTGRVGLSHRNSGPAVGVQAEPTGVAADRAGDLVVSGPVGGTGLLWLLPAHDRTEFGRRVRAGDVYVLASCPGRRCAAPGSATFDQAGNVLFNVHWNSPSGVQDRVYVIAVRTGRFYGRPMTAGHRYPLAGAGANGASGNGGPALRARVTFGPVAVDHHGNVLIGNDGSVRVVAATSGMFYGIAMTAGDIYSIQAHCCTEAFQEIEPWSIAVDAAGNVIETDPGDDRVQVLAVATGTFYGVPMTAGGTYTIAGDGITGFSGDGGPATAAELAGPAALAVTPSGAIAFTDLSRIRMISP